MSYTVKVIVEIAFWIAVLGISAVLSNYAAWVGALCFLLGCLLYLAWWLFPNPFSK